MASTVRFRTYSFHLFENFYSYRWIQAFRTHIEDMNFRLRNGDLKVKISNATSRALIGDTSLAVIFF